MPALKRLLILGGTTEARALAKACVRRFKGRIETISSLAGRTRVLRPIVGDLRIGGFGGGTGLARYIRDQNIDFVVDATHPFAAKMSANARIACAKTKRPRLQIVRPTQPIAGVTRHEVADLRAAAKLLPRLGKRAFLTIGRTELSVFAKGKGVWLLVRVAERPTAPLALPAHRVVVGLPPYTLAEEKRLMTRHRIDVLVTKASGGPATETKLRAARDLDIPVIEVRRPKPEPGPTVETVKAALAWIAAALGPVAARERQSGGRARTGGSRRNPPLPKRGRRESTPSA